MFNEKARPPKDAKIDPEAVKLCPYTDRQIRDFPLSQIELKELFGAWLEERVDKFNKEDKMLFIAYNAKFDYNFCRTLWITHGDNFFNSFFWWPYLDMMSIMAWALADKRSLLPNFKLETVLKACGIIPDKTALHDAMYDCRLVRQLYYYLEK